VSVSPTGGTPPYTYSWSNNTTTSGTATDTLKNLGAGTYSVTVSDANGCSSVSATETITAPVILGSPSATSNFNGNGVSCNGNTDGFVSVSPTGGTPPYTYSWSNNTTTSGTATDT